MSVKIDFGIIHRVQRVIRTGSTARGVVANVNGVSTTFSLSPKGRVVLSGGALKSPVLLMKSGIGDPAVLERLQKADRLGGLQSSFLINNTAVGANLCDSTNTFIELSSPSIQSYVYTYENPPAADQALYLQHRSGPYSFASEISVFEDTVKRSDNLVLSSRAPILSLHADYIIRVCGFLLYIKRKRKHLLGKERPRSDLIDITSWSRKSGSNRTLTSTYARF